MSQRPMHSPLDDSHLSQIRSMEPVIERARAQIELAKRAGIPVDEHAKQLVENADKLSRIKQVYFPGE